MERGITFEKKDVLRAAKRELWNAEYSNDYSVSQRHINNILLLVLFANTLGDKVYFIPAN